MMKAVKRIRMANMPFDKFENGTFVHATGDLVKLEDGSMMIASLRRKRKRKRNCHITVYMKMMR